MASVTDFVPYADRAFVKSHVDMHLGMMWESRINPYMHCLLNNAATGEFVSGYPAAADDVSVSFSLKISSIADYRADDEGISFKCSLRGKKTSIHIPYSCILRVHTNPVDLKNPDYDAHTLVFPMCRVVELQRIGLITEPSQIESVLPDVKPKPKAEVPVVTSVESNVIYVDFGRKK